MQITVLFDSMQPFKPRANGGNVVGQHYSQYCWMLHVVSICTPCCMLLGVVVQNKRVKHLSQQLPTFLFLRDRQSVKCNNVGSVYTALPTLLGPRTCIITHGLYSLMGCILPTIHCMSEHCWELLHPFVNNCQHGCNNSQHCWCNNVWICCIRLHVALK